MVDKWAGCCTVRVFCPFHSAWCRIKLYKLDYKPGAKWWWFGNSDSQFAHLKSDYTLYEFITFWLVWQDCDSPELQDDSLARACAIFFQKLSHSEVYVMYSTCSKGVTGMTLHCCLAVDYCLMLWKMALCHPGVWKAGLCPLPVSKHWWMTQTQCCTTRIAKWITELFLRAEHTRLVSKAQNFILQRTLYRQVK